MKGIKYFHTYIFLLVTSVTFVTYTLLSLTALRMKGVTRYHIYSLPFVTTCYLFDSSAYKYKSYDEGNRIVLKNIFMDFFKIET